MPASFLDQNIIRQDVSTANYVLVHFTDGEFLNSLGPNPTVAPWPSAAVQLHQTSRSSIVQHFRGAKVGSADKV